MGIEIKQCASCGEPIYWLKHARTGKPAPIEVRTVEKGDILVNLTAGTYGKVTDPVDHETYKTWLHLNHFASCPQAATWKRHGSR